MGYPGVPESGNTWCSTVHARVEASRIGRLVRNATTRADRPHDTDGDRRAAGDQSRAAARAVRPEDDAERDPGGARCERHPGDRPRAEKGHVQEPRPAPGERGERDRGERAAAGKTVEQAHSERPLHERFHHGGGRPYDPKLWSNVRVFDGAAAPSATAIARARIGPISGADSATGVRAGS
jgi:hypothetical protein